MNKFIGVAGNIGVGKTTFTKALAERLQLKSYFESVIDNPYLSDFYGDMHRWSFQLQIYFLHHRFRTHSDMSKYDGGVVQDRTIYEDVEIFARNLYEMGNMTQRDWDNYRNLFSIMTSFLRKPDLIIYLQASTDTLLSRIRGRDRDFERSIDPEYLHRLNVAYDQWINRIKEREPVMVVDTNRFNIFRDEKRLETILAEIQERLAPSQLAAEGLAR
ncbi:MAG: deoxynucleoside kinase [Candidatus Marinimicrobia bacterium]|nr:deoxynucleoside kinase [Candidatus Neomarinimicrobiota bacterium]MCH7939163.1 deoxynucleoside kinase [Candidatus Neomarinimicrobiota bacterium]